jgi:hypothetical protein
MGLQVPKESIFDLKVIEPATRSTLAHQPVRLPPFTYMTVVPSIGISGGQALYAWPVQSVVAKYISWGKGSPFVSNATTLLIDGIKIVSPLAVLAFSP